MRAWRAFQPRPPPSSSQPPPPTPRSVYVRYMAGCAHMCEYIDVQCVCVRCAYGVHVCVYSHPLLHQTAACPTVARMAGVIERLRRHSEGEDFTAYLRAVGLMRGGGGIGGGKCRSGEVASAVEWPPHRYLLGLEAARAQCAVRMTKNPVRMERITPASRSQ